MERETNECRLLGGTILVVAALVLDSCLSIKLNNLFPLSPEGWLLDGLCVYFALSGFYLIITSGD